MRNHIKIEQQLKLHIECLQDKLEDAERSAKNAEKEREARRAQEESMAVRESKRYRELLDIRETEVERLNAEVDQKVKENEEVKK